MGDTILGLLTGQKMLDNPESASEFSDRLTSVFGLSGTRTLQFIIVKELYRRLNLPFDHDGLFDYATFLETARRRFLSRTSLND